jgi:cold shock protein
MTAHRMSGTVERFEADRGFGFIKPDDGSDAIFMHVSEITRRFLPVRGERVSFVVGQDRDGRLRAKQVELMEQR